MSNYVDEASLGVGGSNSPPDASDQPTKRKPGRPRGSGKKYLDADGLSKLKRPVGRPRKDGLPAGSVGSSRPRKSSQDALAQPSALTTEVYRPKTKTRYAPGPFLNGNLDPQLQDGDDWADLARTKPSVFLNTLILSLSAPNPISSAGPSVEEAFKSHLVSLAPGTSQSHHIPSLYSIMKTFWLPSSPSYFSLTASASTARTPSEHRFLYWDPQPLVFNGISCPTCSASLINKGRIRSGPIKIYDIERPFFIIGCEYVCKSPQCTSATSADGRKFSSTDPSILRSLPIKLKGEFPARLMHSETDAGSGPNIWNWQGRGVSRSLWNMIQGCLRSNMRRDAILKLIDAIQNGVPEGSDNGHEDGANAYDEAEMQQHITAANAQSRTLHDTTPDYGQKDNYTDAYHVAWNTNTAAADSNNTAHPPDVAASPAPPNSIPSTATQGIGATSGQSFVFPQPTPYAPFRYPSTSYAFPNATSASQSTSATPASILVPGMSSGTIVSTPNTPNIVPGNTTPANMQTPGTNPSTPKLNPSHLKRAYPYTNDAGSTSDTSPNQDPSNAGHASELSRKRSPRHCSKCGSPECKGKGGRSHCMNACQDCGKLECRGRNSRRPDKSCTEGWA